MSVDFKSKIIKALGELKEAPSEYTQEELRETYPAITLEDAKRVKQSLLDLLEAKTEAERVKAEKAYKAVHAELRKKYKKSGRQ